MTDRATVEALADLLRPWGEVRFKPMFGEWGVYIDERFCAIIGDGKLFLKVKGVPEETVDMLFGGSTEPYPGAKNYALIAPEKFDAPDWCTAAESALRAANVLVSV
jgi:TfoX/Sxy family transcriptional regulator of competence genes